jgi:hypothetical protein
MKHSLMKLAPVVLVFAGMAACGGDSTTPPSGLVGTYQAVEFTTTGSSGQTNQLLAGSTLNIALSSDHTTSGHVHVAASGSSPAFDADLTGTWIQTGNSVNFSQPADTFVESMTFAVVAASGGAWDLVGDGTFSGTAVHVTLRQQSNL